MTATKSKLDTGLVRELAAILREADLGEIEVEHEGLRVRVTKPPAPMPIQTAAPVYSGVSAPIEQAPQPALVAPAPEPAGAPENAVTSPMVGTVYLSPEPSAAAFIKVGDKVKAGQTLLLVEAMKTFNPVESPRAGVVSQILVGDAQPVEFGEALVVIE